MAASGRRLTAHRARGFVLLLIAIAIAAVIPQSSLAGTLPLPPAPSSPEWHSDARSPEQSSPSSQSDSSSDETIVPGRYIVVLKDSVDHPGSVARSQVENQDGNLKLVYRYALKGYAAQLSDAAVSALRRNPNVKYVVPDHKVTVQSQTSPTGIKRTFTTQREALKINEKEDFSVNVDVAVIDTGVDPNQPDLNLYKRASCVPAGEGATQAEREVSECVEGIGTDPYGHGTHVAGTIGAKDNGFGVVGIAPGARLWGVRVLSAGGVGYTSWIIAGVDWVTAHASQIEVANMSLGCACKMPALDEAINASVEAGVVYAVAAGNDGANANFSTPASNPNVIAVAALADSDGLPGGNGPSSCLDRGSARSLVDDQLASFSNWGSSVDVAAPGVCILSTVPVGGSKLSPSTTVEYETVSGTSMASPHVAGAAAVIASEQNPENKKDVEAIRQQIIENGNLNYVDTRPDLSPPPLLDLVAPEASVSTGGTSDADPEGKSIVLHGAAQPGGSASSYYFEYGETESYGSTTASQEQTAKTTYVQVAKTATALKGGTTYHYRLVGKSGSNTYYGSDRTFELRNPIGPSDWVVQATPSIEWSPVLNDISCVSSSFCMAVGEIGEEEKTLAEKWNGSAWNLVSSPNPAASQNRLDAVSCTSSSFCMALQIQPGSGGGTYVHQWNGEKWSTSFIAGKYLPGISCLSSTWCMAAGQIGGSSQPAALRWNGAVWTSLEVPFLPKEAYFLGLSCPSTSYCKAVGIQVPGSPEYPYPMAAQWNGSTWSVNTVPKPTKINFPKGSIQTGEDGILTDVSCMSASDCMAVGEHDWMYKDESEYVEYGTSGFVERWHEGAWTVTSLDSDRQMRLGDVSCVTADQCIAVGREIATEFGPIIHRWDGTQWSDEFTAGLDDDQEYIYSKQYLFGASCLQDGACLIVGQQFHAETCETDLCFGFLEALVEYAKQVKPTASTGTATNIAARHAALNATINPGNDDTSYHFEYDTVPYKAGEGAHGTSVPIPDKAIGSGWNNVEVSQVSEGLQPGTTYHYRVVATSAIGTATGEDREFKTLSGLPRVSSVAVTQVGPQQATLNAKINPESFATTYRFEYGPTTSYGSKAPVPDEGIGSGEADVAVAKTIGSLSAHTTYHFRVVATNAKGTTNGEDLTFYTGAWSTQSTLNPTQSLYKLGDVSCISSSLCLAVGDDAYAARGFGEVWSGSAWGFGGGAATGAGLRTLANHPVAISCVSVSFCAVVGTTPAGGLAADKWYEPVPNTPSLGWGSTALGAPATPEGGTGPVFKDVSCTSSTACTAVGYYSKEGVRKTLAERWNGSNWSIQTTTNPASGNAELLGVSCSSATSCAAVGKKGSETYAESWNGSSWSASTPLNVSGATQNVLSSISCTSSTACTAVGYSGKSEFERSALVERWNGSAWTTQSTPTPAEAKGSVELFGVVCTGASACVAVGTYVSETIGGLPTATKTLAYSWNGSSWSIQSSPNGEGKKGNALEAVSCTAVSACTAVGRTGGAPTGGEYSPLAEGWS